MFVVESSICAPADYCSIALNLAVNLALNKIDGETKRTFSVKRLAAFVLERKRKRQEEGREEEYERTWNKSAVVVRESTSRHSSLFWPRVENERRRNGDEKRDAELGRGAVLQNEQERRKKNATSESLIAKREEINATE